MIRRVVLVAVLVAACIPAIASAAAAPIAPAGVQRLHFRYGPIRIAPGDNRIHLRDLVGAQRPPGPGFITSFHPQLTYLDGRVPRVDAIHLHHGVWLVDGQPTWAAGEEKTTMRLAAGFGYRYDPSQRWLLNDMIHNLTPGPTKVYVTWDMDFVPDSSPLAKTMTTVHTQWLDVEAGRAYPVFDALRSAARADGTFTFPTDAKNAYPDGRPRNTWTVDRDSTLVGTAGHVHPGGLHTDLWLTRGAKKIRLFQSHAHYFEPAGPVSWDLAMTNTPTDWRVNVKAGDKLSVTGTYGVSKASWYESMAIMPVSIASGTQMGVDPFTHHIQTTGPLNHGHLPENDHHGGGFLGLPDARAMISGSTPAGETVDISNFLYGRGDLTLAGSRGRPPAVRQGESLTFKNLDAARNIFHTVTACRLPCNRDSGIAYPLANGSTGFDSGELGFGPFNFTAAANRDTWSTPTTLKPGTYTYFCRIHPFMRGSFRVIR